MSSEVASIKLVTFDGNEKNWRNFETKFKAFMTAKKLKSIFKTGLVIPKVGDEEKSDGSLDSDKVKIQEMNETVYNLLVLSIDTTKPAGQVALDLVTGTEEDAKYPNGNFVTAWELLKEKYKPTDITAQKVAEKSFNEHDTLGRKEDDPEVYFGQLQVFCEDLNQNYSKDY